jgi:Domain of unknown function (DUF5664)
VAKKKKAKQTGDRFNNDKLRQRNVPTWWLEPVIEVGAKGEVKYETFNFLKGQYVLDCLDSLRRHLEKFENPWKSDFDEETKLNHMAHLAWNALEICYVMKHMPNLDNRWKPDKKKRKK